MNYLQRSVVFPVDDQSRNVKLSRYGKSHLPLLSLWNRIMKTLITLASIAATTPVRKARIVGATFVVVLAGSAILFTAARCAAVAVVNVASVL